MKNIQRLALAALAVVALFLAVPQAAVLADSKSVIKGGINDANGGGQTTNPNKTINDTIASVINLLSLAVGVLAVIMIIVGGLRYITSAGNPEGAKTAKNTILYALIGLVIVALAQVIVRFVLNKTTT